MQAKAINAAVEVTGDRTESSTTWVLPNGTFRKDMTAGPVRVQKDDGSWGDIDLGLVKVKGGYAPASSPRPVLFSDGGQGAAARFTRDGRTLRMGWKGSLAEPTIAGDTATYELSATQDLVLRATVTGFEQSLVIKTRPAASDPAPVVQLPLSLDGVDAKPAKDGSVTFGATQASGKGADRVAVGDPVFTLVQPVMFGADTDAKTKLPKARKDLDAAVDATPTGAFAGADAVVSITADQAFLQDPATQYPVTIDPVIGSVSSLGDTWVGAGNPTANFDIDQHLRVGSWYGDTSTLWKFDDSAFNAQHVTAASLNFYMDYTGSCTASAVNVYPNTGNFDASTVTWNTKPAYDASRVVSKSMAHGFSGTCAAAYDSIDVTSIVSAWAFNTIPDYGFQIKADPADVAQSKSICSMTAWGSAPCNDFWKTPSLSVTYNSYPWAPQSNSVTFTPRVEGTTGRTYSTSLNPTVQAKVGNSDGSPVKLQAEVSRDPAYAASEPAFTWTGTGAAAAPLSTATVQVSPALVTARHFQYRVRGAVNTSTGGTDYGPWSGYQLFGTNTSLPAAPTVSCASYAVNTWTASTGGAVSCSLSTTSTDGSGYFWGLDDPSVPNVQENGTNTGATQSISINPGEGYHTLYARTRDTALLQSAGTTKYVFGVGKGGILSPKANAQTQASVALTSQSSSSYTTIRYDYRAGTSGTWVQVPFANVYPPGSGTPISSWPAGTVSGSVTNYTQLNWNAAATLAAAGQPDGAVQVRACFNPSGTVWCSAGTTFVLGKTAFAATAATSDLGPGTVSLVTGDFAVDESDASQGGLSIGRTSTNLVPPAASSGPSGVFGAGWTTAAFGPDAGVGMFVLNDNSTAGSITLSDSSGTKAIYTGTAGGTFTGVGDAADGSTLVKSGATWKLTETDGTVTTWTLLSGTTYVTSQVQETGTEGTSTYTRDGTGRVTQIIGAPPTGVTCTSSSLVKGCRALQITYATATTATGTTEATWGTYTGLTSKIEYTAWDPATSGMLTTQVANYLYDNTGHLRAEWDPRISPALKTRYTYDANGRLATETDPGRATWTMAYDTSGRLSSVSRPDPSNGTATQAVAYGIPLSGTNLPDVTSATAATWNQTTDQAYTGAAVFPASKVPTAGGGGVYSPISTEWAYADLTYVDVNGRAVNTASFGAGAWQIDTTRYDDTGNTIWSLSARNRAQALTPTADTDPYTATQPSTAVRADLLSTTNTYSGSGVDLLTSLAPAHPAYISYGTYSSIRVKTTNTYDQGAPGGATFHLVTTTKVAAVPLDGAATTAYDTSTTTIGYDPIDGAANTGNTSGWTHRQPTVTTTVMGTVIGAADIVKKARYDTSGRVLESRMPESTGGDAGTTINVYYTADTSASVPACRSHAEWAGLLCQSGPQTQPSGTTVPVASTVYNMWDQPTVATETSGTSTRISTTSYDGAGRATSVAISASPAGDAGTALPTVTTSYDSATGDATSVTDGSQTISTAYNSIGQATTYTDADSQATANTYDIDGNLKTSNDGKGTYTYTYDGTDAAGQTERRGLLTSLDVGITGSPSTFTAAYDQDGNLTTQNYPNGLRQNLTYDNTGDQRTMTYDKQVAGTWTTWMSFGSGADRDGHTVWQGSPGSYQSFGYDNNDRLTYVDDYAQTGCTTRRYTFSKNGNRTALTSGNPATDRSCQTSTTSTATTSYDAADRDTNSGYSYDTFGRTLTVPATDVTGTGALNVGYFSNDMVASQAQGSTSKLFGLDPARRLRAAIDYTSGAETRRITNHYNDAGDTPSWITTSTDAGATNTWQRNVTGITGDLAILQNQTGTPQIQLSNPHGDVVATVDDNAAATSTNAYFESTEYGTPRATNSTNPARYAWLGSKQRSNDDLGGLTLMGVRLYVPAIGKFLSNDPVLGGNENSYAYPNNPIDMFDLSGKCGGPFSGLCKLGAGTNRFFGSARRTTSRATWATVGFFSNRPYIEGGQMIAHSKYRGGIKHAYYGSQANIGSQVYQRPYSSLGGRLHGVSNLNHLGRFVSHSSRLATNIYGPEVSWTATGLDYAHVLYLRRKRRR